MSRTPSSLRAISRRTLLAGVAGAGLASAAVGLGGCTVRTTSDEGGITDRGDITIPDSGAQLPEGDVSIRWLSGGPGAKSEVFKALFPAYSQKHPNLTVEYEELPNARISETLPLQVRNDELPDVFQVLGIPLPELINGNRITPLDDIIPGFAEWKAAMPFGVIAPGINEFDGKTYALPTDLWRRCSMLLFNPELMERADVDPVAEPLTPDSFRETARKITTAAGEEAFGLMLGGKDGGLLVAPIAELTMLSGGAPDFDWATGQFAYHDDVRIEMIELFKAMIDEGSVFPGWASLGDQEARAQFPLGRTGMILSGGWNFPVWANDAPDFEFGVAAPPASGGYVSAGIAGNTYAVAANAPDDHKIVAGDLLHFLGTQAGQEAWALYDGAADPAWSTEAIATVQESGLLPDADMQGFEIFADMVRIAPNPLLRNPENEAVARAQTPLVPTQFDIIQGYLLGDVTDLRAEQRKLSDNAERNLDEAIATARSNGADVSREDRVFENWDPSADFTEQDY